MMAAFVHAPIVHAPNLGSNGEEAIATATYAFWPGAIHPPSGPYRRRFPSAEPGGPAGRYQSLHPKGGRGSLCPYLHD